jgi:hypothetical protein
MKRILAMIGWSVGSVGAVLWTFFWTFVMIYTHKFPLVMFVNIGVGIFGAWEGFKAFRQARTRT